MCANLSIPDNSPNTSKTPTDVIEYMVMQDDQQRRRIFDLEGDVMVLHSRLQWHERLFQWFNDNHPDLLGECMDALDAAERDQEAGQ